MMQAELSAKSRAILFNLKQNLQKQKISFLQLVCSVFDFKKQKFDPKQFAMLIKKYDGKLVLLEVDQMFEQLDSNRNGFVFYEDLEEAIASTSQVDNPDQQLNRKSHVKDKPEQTDFQVLIKLKDLLLGTQDYIQVIQLFSTEQRGYISQQNIKQLMDNFDMTDQLQVTKVLELLFGSKSIIEIKSLIETLNLQSKPQRLSFKEEINQQSNQMPKSKFIHEQLQESRIKLSHAKQHHKSGHEDNHEGILKFENVPESLKAYYNYGSELEEDFAYLAFECLQNKVIYIDPKNPGYSKAAKWVHLMEIHPHYSIFHSVESRHGGRGKGELAQMMSAKDIQQGSIGDCYFLSAIAAVAEDYPELIYKLFVVDKNPSHIFGVRLFVDGIWKTFSLDGCFPMHKYRGLCGARPIGNQIWVMLLEKAWAKCFHSYDNIHSGQNEEGLVAITGAPGIFCSSRSQGFIAKVSAEVKKGSKLTCATSREVYQLTSQQQQKLGVFSGHAYTLLSIYPDIPYNNSTITLLKVKNPWGRKGWRGDWSANSPKWTNQLKKLISFNNSSQDGTFCISLADFVMYFDHIHISRVNLANQNSWVINHTNRYEFCQNRVTIKEPGDYFFTLYQENTRKYKKYNSSIQKSKSWIFLARIHKQSEHGAIQRIVSIASSATKGKDNTIETTLSAGNYLILTRIMWNYWEDYHFTVTSYGPGKVKFSNGFQADTNLVQQFIENRSNQLINIGAVTTKIYKNLNVSESTYFSASSGIGFIRFNNNEKNIFQNTLRLEGSIGIHPIRHTELPFVTTVMPYCTGIIPFLVHPEGYQYTIKQHYKMIPV